MDQAMIASLIARDPAVQHAMDTIFGKSDERTILEVLTAPSSVVISKALTVPKASVPRIAAPKLPRPPRNGAPTGTAKAPVPPQAATAPAPPAAPKVPTVKAIKPPTPPEVTTAKSADIDLTFTTEFSKMDEDQKTVFGWASITEIDGSPVIDRQGDTIDIEELSKSAYDYVVSSRAGGHQHQRDPFDMPLKVSDMIESVVFTPEKIAKMGLPPTTPIGWWVGYKVNDDEIWKAVKDGNITGFSVHGKGRRIPVAA